MNRMWSYSVQSLPAPMDSLEKTSTGGVPSAATPTAPGTPMAYCPIAAPPQPVWRTASVAVAHVRNAVYTGTYMQMFCWYVSIVYYLWKIGIWVTGRPHFLLWTYQERIHPALKFMFFGRKLLNMLEESHDRGLDAVCLFTIAWVRDKVLTLVTNFSPLSTAGMPYDAAAAAAGNYSSQTAHPPLPAAPAPAAAAAAAPTAGSSGGMQGANTPSHLGPFVLTPASPHTQLSFQAHTQALYSPMEILPTVQPLGIPYSSPLSSHGSSSCAFSTAAS